MLMYMYKYMYKYMYIICYVGGVELLMYMGW